MPALAYDVAPRLVVTWAPVTSWVVSHNAPRVSHQARMIRPLLPLMAHSVPACCKGAGSASAVQHSMVVPNGELRAGNAESWQYSANPPLVAAAGSPDWPHTVPLSPGSPPVPVWVTVACAADCAAVAPKSPVAPAAPYLDVTSAREAVEPGAMLEAYVDPAASPQGQQCVGLSARISCRSDDWICGWQYAHESVSPAVT